METDFPQRFFRTNETVLKTICVTTIKIQFMKKIASFKIVNSMEQVCEFEKSDRPIFIT